MRRDWDLVRKILLKTEELSTPSSHLDPDAVHGFDAENVSYHIKLMGQAGLLEVTHVGGVLGQLHYLANSLTWEGHEFLDKIRRDTMWNKIKGTLREKGLDLSVEAIKLGAKVCIESLLKQT